MIKKYLEKTKQELLVEKDFYNQLLLENKMLIEENQTMIDIIRNTEDKNSKSFLPSHSSIKENTKLQSLENVLKSLENKRNEIIENLNQIEIKSKELYDVMEYVNSTSTISNKDDIVLYLKDFFNSSYMKRSQLNSNCDSEYIKSLKHKLNNFSNYLNFDVMRCKLELEKLLKEIDEQIVLSKNNSFKSIKNASTDFNIYDVLEKERQFYKTNSSINFSFNICEELYEINIFSSITIYLLLINLLEYATVDRHAKNIKLNSHNNSSSFTLNIKDNGKKILLSDLKYENMKKYASILQSNLKIKRDKNQNIVIINIPKKECFT